MHAKEAFQGEKSWAGRSKRRSCSRAIWGAVTKGSGDRFSKSTAHVVAVTNAALLSECMPVGESRRAAVFKCCVNMYGAPIHSPDRAAGTDLGAIRSSRSSGTGAAPGSGRGASQPRRKHRGLGSPQTEVQGRVAAISQLSSPFLLCKAAKLETGEARGGVKLRKFVKIMIWLGESKLAPVAAGSHRLSPRSTQPLRAA